MENLQVQFEMTLIVEFSVSCQVELKATTKDPGTTLRAPTSETGLAPACKDTCFADLTLQLWERRYDGTKGKVCSASHAGFSL